MTTLKHWIIAGLLAGACTNASHTGDLPTSTDTGYLPDTEETDSDTNFDTDPGDIPDIDYAMPCLDYQLFSYNAWVGDGGEAFAINDDDIAVGRKINFDMFAGPDAQHMPFVMQHFNSYTDRHFGMAFNTQYYLNSGLPEPDLRNLSPVDVNSAGFMAGHGNHPGDRFIHAFYMDPDGVYQRLFTDETESVPSAINESGQIVGYHYESWWDFSGGSPLLVEESRGFLWHDNITPPTYLDPLPGAPADAQVEPHDLNDAGQVVGGAVDANGLWQAFIWEDGPGYTLLTPLGGGEAVAHGINTSGVVVGESLDSDDVWKPVVWDEAGAITNLGLLTTIPMSRGAARAVNDHDVVVGWDEPVSVTAVNRAWVWKDGVKTDLTATNNPHNRHYFATAHDINNNGLIIGGALLSGIYPYSYGLIPQDCGIDPDTDSGN